MGLMNCPGCGKRRRTKPGTPVVCQCYCPGTKEYKARKKRELAALSLPAPTLTLTLAASPRYRMIQDEECHWYVIRVGQVEEFNLWQDAMAECEKWDSFDFNDVRVNGPHTVTFPEWKEEV